MEQLNRTETLSLIVYKNCQDWFISKLANSLTKLYLNELYIDLSNCIEITHEGLSDFFSSLKKLENLKKLNLNLGCTKLNDILLKNIESLNIVKTNEGEQILLTELYEVSN